MKAVRVSRRAAQRIAAGHPWVYSSEVTDNGGAEAGEAVRVMEHGARPLGVAHYSDSSQIALRLLDTKLHTPDVTFYRRRIAAALAFRRRVVVDSTACRLVYSEADRLPGLIVDSYDGHLSVQFLSQGMDRDRAIIVEALTAELQPRSITARNDAATRRLENLPLDKELLLGDAPGVVPVRLNGLIMHADILGGQKTGVFLDQRENYAAVARLARAFAVRHALDCFTSTGGFALHLAGCVEKVEAIDASGAALELARQNSAANALANIQWREADVFELLARYATARRHYDLVVLDPPAFAKSRGKLEQALRGYREINGRALRLLSPGGILVTCSCSHHVSESDLLSVVAGAAREAGHSLRVLERRTQAADHPILLAVPETLYLKCLILEVV
jgi:23S rRNA (cytosine1962-C5)-methyltransferase